MSMWILLIILLAPNTGVESASFLNKFDTLAECTTEQQRITTEMAVAYPGDESYRIECREKKSKGTAIGLVEEPITQYGNLIKEFAKKRFPKQELSIRVTGAKAVQNESGHLPVEAIQIDIFPNGDQVGETFLLLIKDKKILGWIDVGEAVEEEELEVFGAQDQA